jgi:phosphoribosylformylglycinamidine cyclo-ligase
VNDILMQGAEPLFFLDYLAVGKLDVDVAEQVIAGLSEGCRRAGCSLIGGETAEMPGFYNPGEYDVAGTIVGVVDKENIIDGTAIREGDPIIALKSSGMHTNGYSLARKVLLDSGRYKLDEHVDALGRTPGEELLEPHRCYAKPIQAVMDALNVRGMAHITGGGLTDNIPRILPKDLDAELELGSWQPLAVFDLIRRSGDIAEAEMLRTFNMGVGMVLIVSPDEESAAMKILEAEGEEAWRIGCIVKGSGLVKYAGKL